MSNGSQHPFLRPLWRRVALVAVCFIWAGIEFYAGSPNWGTMVAALGVYAAWQYLYAYKPAPEASTPEASTPEAGTTQASAAENTAPGAKD